MSEDDDPQRRVRQLLLSGDNMLKNRHQEAAGRARGRFEEARRVAREAGLPESVMELIDRRLEALDQRVGVDAP